MERKIYNGWAFTENEVEKGKMNWSIYQELTKKYKIYRDDMVLNPDVNLKDYDVVIGRKAGYAHADYNILKNGPGLSHDELLLLCDEGNLCFGGRFDGENRLSVSED